MRSRSSHSSHRSHSSMHSSHRSSFSRSHSSMHRSSLHGSMHKSGLHKSSIGSSRMHKSSFKRNGISNAHAFAVGKSTGINVNGSALGAHGAALHRFERMRKMSKDNSRLRHNRMVSSFSRRHRGTNFNNRRSTDDFIRRMRVSHNKHTYTSPKYDYSQFSNIGEELNNTINEASRYVWIPILIIAIIMIFFALGIGFFIFTLHMRTIFM